jgi:putative glycosyltransferase (TIGR04348 family)
MNIWLVTPAAKGTLNGNRVTAVRWGRILKQLGHQVQIDVNYGGQRCDLMIAIHAWRSAPAVAAFKKHQPGAPLVVLLAGTDIYRFQHSDPAVTLRSMASADSLVGLHDRVAEDIPAEFASKLRIIYQSCPSLGRRRTPTRRHFKVCVVGHLREEKDPFRAALAARQVPDSSKLRVVHLGAAHTPDWADAAHEEARINHRYVWHGEVSKAQVRRHFTNSHAMVMSSVMEGGANVVSEAIVAGLPVIASDISGNRGLLGDAHEAYYPAGDENALAQLLLRAETNPGFLPAVSAEATRGAARFSAEAELEHWRALLADLG